LLAALCVGGAAATPARAGVRAMSLPDALAYGRAHQPTLRSALSRVTAAEADAGIPRAQWSPTFGAALEAFEGTTNNTTAQYVGAPHVDLPRIGATRAVGGFDAPGVWRPATSTLAAVGANQEVFDFGRIAAQAAVSDLAAEAERRHAEGERLRIDLVIREAYYGVLGAQAVLRAAEGAFQRARGHRDLAAAGVKSGLHAPIELTRAEADLTRFDVGQIRAGGAVRGAQAVFAAAVGVDDLLLDAVGEPPAPAPQPPLGDALQRAADRDPALKEARARAGTAEAVTRAVGAETRPDLALTATFSARMGTATPSSGAASDKYGPLPSTPNWDVGLVLRWPFLDPVVSARGKAAAARAETARADLAAASQQERARVQEAYVALEESEAALLGLDRALDAARANYAQAEARFKAGLGTSLELADAETVRTDAEIQVAVGQFEARRASAVVTRLLGED
jgi:outer membrane protein TolC